MQTLTAGSFLNLENASTVEALKHTARRLAEASATVVKENLNHAALENLANSLWGKAEYVTRETERRRLHQIFNENFSERFRELKLETRETQNSGFEVLPAAAPVENVNSPEASNAPEIVELVKRESAATSQYVSSSVSPEAAVTVAEGKRDEFLGFVEPGVLFDEPPTAETSATAATEEATTALEEAAPTAVKNADKLIAEPSKPENQSAAAPETLSSASESEGYSDGKDEPPTAENFNHAKTETTAIPVPAGSKPTTATTTDGREPFEFEKCTINLNLTLLPAELGKNTRKVIVGAVSHNLPPEIDFLEIAENGNLTQIADAVREKLERFKQTLPVKYIEQLRASKTKSAKKTAPTKATTTAAPTQSAVDPATAAKRSGEQKAPETIHAETEKPQPEAMAAEMNNTTVEGFAPVPTVNQSVAANSIQGSLF
ncbi:MAG: hypothetical protein WKF90_02505 [Pyrinomonadaceae bacterium]